MPFSNARRPAAALLLVATLVAGCSGTGGSFLPTFAQNSNQPTADNGGVAASPSAPTSPGQSSAPPSAGPTSGAPTGGAQAGLIQISTDQRDERRYEPGEATVGPSAVVTLQFLNAATIEHGLRFGAPINAGTPDRVAPQDNVEFQFTAPSEPGEYEFVCPVHPNMKGRLIVSETVGP